MAKRHLTRKEMKQPDQFVSYSVQVMEWAKAHFHALLYGTLGFIAIIAALVAWSIWQQQRQQQAEALLYETVQKLNPDGNRRDADPDQTLPQLQRIIEEYSTTPASAFAHWYQGHQYYAQGDYTAALTAYHQAQSQFSRQRDLLMPVLITLNIAYAQEASGHCDAAIPNFDNVLQSSINWLRGEAFLGLGRCHEKQGAITEAINLYNRALSDTAIEPMIRQKIEEQHVRLRAAQERAKQ